MRIKAGLSRLFDGMAVDVFNIQESTD